MRAVKSKFTPVRMTKSCAKDLGFLARHFGVSKGQVIRDLIEREAVVVRTKRDRMKAAA